MRTLLTELRRRRVFRVVGTYLIAAFVLLQAADLVVEPLRLPEWTLPLLIVLMGVGLPVAVILAWAFDVGPDGVQRTPPAAPATPPDAQPMPPGGAATARVRDSHGWLMGGVGIGILLAVVGIGAYTTLSPTRPAPEVEGIRSLAVLPFVNMTPNPDDEYFSDGITEELLNVLAQVPGLNVAARTSSFEFKGANLDLREVGRRLGVQAVLEGSVRRDGERVRITAQLIDARTGYHLWSQAYDRELSSVFAVQDEISRAIAEALELKLGTGELPDAAAGATTSREAHDLYLLGLHRWNQRTFEAIEEALDYFGRATQADPAYARAHAGSALAYAVITQYGSYPVERARSEGRAAAERALELEPDLPEAHAALAQIAQVFEYDLPTAERRARRAIELNPNYATAHGWLAETLGALGRFDEARAANRRALEIDPLAIPLRAMDAYLLYMAWRLPEAESAFRRVLEIAPDAPPVLINAGLVSLHLERYEEATELLERAARGAGTDPRLMHLLVAAVQEPPLRPRALAALGEAPAGLIAALFHMLLEDDDNAMATLERAYQEKQDGYLAFAASHPVFEPIRGTDRFRTFARAMGVE